MIACLVANKGRAKLGRYFQKKNTFSSDSFCINFYDMMLKLCEGFLETKKELVYLIISKE